MKILSALSLLCQTADHTDDTDESNDEIRMSNEELLDLTTDHADSTDSGLGNAPASSARRSLGEGGT
ncbi:MAG: hypothetical protein DME74_06290 [Verrucomicrobia bacterium]|nr:MAG: hypothetical protein DME74_06290 [Verrucomicrobiota bacterium]